MKLKNKLFTTAVCLAVLIALLCISVGAAAQGSIALNFVSLTEGQALVDVALTEVTDGKTVDYAQITLTPKANAKDKEITNVTTAMENLSVEYQVADNGAVTILASPTASGVAVAEGESLCTLHISNVESESTLDYSVSWILCFTDGTDTENSEDITASIGAGTYKTTLQAETHGVLNRYKVSGSVVGGMTKDASKMMTLEQLQAEKGFGNAVGHPMVSYTVEVEKAGTYTIEYVYNVATPSGHSVSEYALTVSVNDRVFTVPFAPRDAGADTTVTNLVGKAVMNVELVKGRNVIRMISCTADNAALVSWMDHDYMDITGPSEAKGIVSTVNHLLPGQSQFVNKWTVNTLTNTEAAGYEYRSTYLGGVEVYTFDGENLPIYELSGVPYVAYTVDVPVDGYYDMQTHLVTKTVTDADEGHLLMFVDGIKYEKYVCDNTGYIVNNVPTWTQYLTAGKHTIVVTSMYEHSYDGNFWCDMAALSVYGGITLAAEQVDPMNWATLREDVYISANGTDTAAGTADAPVATLKAALQRVTDGGTIHIVDKYTLPASESWYAFDGTVTITGGELDLSQHSKVNINCGVIFDDVTVTWMANVTSAFSATTAATVFANGHPLTVKDNVTLNNWANIYGGGDGGVHVESTEMNLFAGNYLEIYGGGFYSNVTGTTKLTVGGNVNQGFGESKVLNHDGPDFIDIMGGGHAGTVGESFVSVGGNAIARMVFGSGRGAKAVTNKTNVSITGAKMVAAYGGGRDASSTANANLTVTGGHIEQVLGGNESASLTGNVNLTITGGEITRRIFGGCYNNSSSNTNHVEGTITMVLGEGLNFSKTYGATEYITARSRYYARNKGETAYLYFTGAAAYDEFVGELAYDPADNALVRSVFAIYEDGKFVMGYTALADAIAACTEGQYIKLTESAVVDVTLTKDLYIDLNGCSLSGSMTGDYKVYGMDTTTDAYGATTGSFNCTGANVVSNFKTDITGAIRRYMAVKGENGYSFNRFYMGITHSSLRPAACGVGYKAIFGGSDTVKSNIASFGYSLQLDGWNAITRTKAGTEFVSGKNITLLLKNYDVMNYGETKLIAKVVVTLNDGTFIESAAYTLTLRDMLESINDNIDAYTADQILAVKEMLSNYELNWKIDKILNYAA